MMRIDYSREEIAKELNRTSYLNRYRRIFLSTLAVLTTVAAAAVLVATLWTPVLKIYGDSMTPTLTENEYVVCLKQKKYKTGDIIAFYYNNKVLVKRVICGPGDYIDIADNGQVFINNEPLIEGYISELAYGETDIKLPYQVGDDQLFVMGDHRSTSLDSRNTAVGTVGNEQIVGLLLFRIWPMNRMGFIK